MAGGLEIGDLEGPFQPKPFYDSMICLGTDLLHNFEFAFTMSTGSLAAGVLGLL